MALEYIDNFDSLFVGKILTSIKQYNVNDSFFVFDPQNQAVIDGGIEICFDESKLIVAWNTEMELFDITTSSINELIGNLDHYQIDPKEHIVGQNLIGCRLCSLKTNWNWYYKLNDEFEPFGNKQFMLNEIVFEFENFKTLQIATIDFEIENNTIVNPKFENQSYLLLSVNKTIKIDNAY